MQYLTPPPPPKKSPVIINNSDNQIVDTAVDDKTKTSIEKANEIEKNPEESLDSKANEGPKKPVVEYGINDTPDSDPEKIEVDTNLYRFIFNTKGGLIELLELKQFKKSNKKNSGVYKLIERLKNDNEGCLAVAGLDNVFSKATFQIFKINKDQMTILTMRAIKNGIEVEKIIELNEKEYDFNLKIKVTNHRPEEYLNTFKLVGVMDMEFDFHDINSLYNDQIATMIDDEGDIITAGDVHFFSDTYGSRQGLTHLKEEPFVMGPKRKTVKGNRDKAKVIWGGIKNRYFTIIYKPKRADWTVRGIDLNPVAGKIENTIPQMIWEAPEVKLAKGESFEETFLVFAGPMKDDIINVARYEKDKFVEMIDYGFMFPRFIKVFDWILNAIIKVIGAQQYWLAIILLTLMVRGCMFPITKKSSMSQEKLKAVTPKMKELKERFKNDTKKLNEEMMKLYRKEGVNPFTSCLPMLIQMPIFIGLYWTFNLTFEVRFKSFLWINDLAVDDRLFALGFTLPLMGSYFNLLPIIYSVINYITMANMPPPQDEMQAQQQKIMKYMFPVMMLLFFYRMPSALVLYFIVSGIWSIVEQKKIRAKLEAMKANSKLP